LAKIQEKAGDSRSFSVIDYNVKFADRKGTPYIVEIKDVHVNHETKTITIKVD
jgi:hypothetical protein